MRSVLSLLLLLTVPLTAIAQTVDASNLTDGTYTYKVTVAGGEITSMVPTRVIVLTPTDPTQPIPPTDPTSIEASIKEIALDTLSKPGATAQSAAGFSAVYSLLASEIKAGNISVVRPTNGTPSDAEQALTRALNLVSNRIANAQDRAAWDHFRTSVSITLAQMVNQGDLRTAAQWTAALTQIHQGIDAATGNPIDPRALASVDPNQAGILDGFDIEKLKALIDLIKTLMELFKSFKS